MLNHLDGHRCLERLVAYAMMAIAASSKLAHSD
jgi:hypothetical protein